MKSKQVKSAGGLAEDARQRLEEIFFQDSFKDLDRATSILQRHFPHHIVEKKGDFLQVLTKDRSVAIASFRGASRETPDFVKTYFGFRPIQP
jgi:hypothetical protein